MLFGFYVTTIRVVYIELRCKKVVNLDKRKPKFIDEEKKPLIFTKTLLSTVNL